MEIITPEDLANHAPLPAKLKIRHVGEMVPSIIEDYLRDPKDIQGYPTKHWPTFNNAFGGARPGEVITLTGETGTGKTTFAMNWLLDTLEQGRPSFLMSLEIGWRATARKIAQMTLGKEFGAIVDGDIRPLTGELEQMPLWVLDWHGVILDDDLFKAIDYAARVKGTRFVVLDHLEYIQKRDQFNSEASSIGGLMRRLCGLANSLDLTLLLIAHPSKLHNGTLAREVGMDDLKGSSSIKQESSAVLSIFQPDRAKPVTQLTFLKIRCDGYSRSVAGRIRFQFNRESLRLLELSQDVEWDD